MGDYEDQLRKVAELPDWEAPGAAELSTALNDVNEAFRKVAGESGFTGKTDDAIRESFDDQASVAATNADVVGELPGVVTSANEALARARTAYVNLPGKSIKDSDKALIRAGSFVFPGIGPIAAEGGIALVEGFLSNDRENKAKEALETLEAELKSDKTKAETISNGTSEPVHKFNQKQAEDHKLPEWGPIPPGGSPTAPGGSSKHPTPGKAKPQAALHFDDGPTHEVIEIGKPPVVHPPRPPFGPDDFGPPTGTDVVSGTDDTGYGTGTGPSVDGGMGAGAVGGLAGAAGVAGGARLAGQLGRGGLSGGLGGGGLAGGGLGGLGAGGLGAGGLGAGGLGQGGLAGQQGTTSGMVGQAGGSGGGAGGRGGTGATGTGGRSNAMMASGGQGQGGGNSRKKQANGLLGLVAPSLDDDGAPQSRSAAAGPGGRASEPEDDEA